MTTPLVIGPATAAMRDGSGGTQTPLVLASAYDVLALALATGLSVFKPGGRRTRTNAGRPSPHRTETVALRGT